ncbi:5204_t:CDS:2 [Paraglomus brasilianum]|uniref:5204_t:CDS:1 n=1 Tax=Paraglomus brasilianum TaxID=144538 RepID=A0A9N9GNX4_9GLOM|nr:5204_t:CDS:2 [Paraglomus brasilianum]
MAIIRNLDEHTEDDKKMKVKFDMPNISENDKNNGGANKLRGSNIFTRSRAAIVLLSMLVLILALWLQSDTRSDASGLMKYFVDTAGDVFDEIGRTDNIVSESLLEPLIVYRDIAPKFSKSAFKGSSEIAESLLELADAAFDSVTSIIAVSDGGESLFLLFRWHLREIIDMINGSGGNIDQEAVDEIKPRLESILEWTEMLDKQVKDAGLKLTTVSNTQTWVLKRLYEGQYEGKRALERDRHRGWLQILFENAVERELRQSELNEILPLIEVTIGVVNEMNHDIPRLRGRVTAFREAIGSLSSELMHSTAQKRISSNTVKYVIDVLNKAEDKYKKSFRKRKENKRLDNS